MKKMAEQSERAAVWSRTLREPMTSSRSTSSRSSCVEGVGWRKGFVRGSRGHWGLGPGAGGRVGKGAQVPRRLAERAQCEAPEPRGRGRNPFPRERALRPASSAAGPEHAPRCPGERESSGTQRGTPRPRLQARGGLRSAKSAPLAFFGPLPQSRVVAPPRPALPGQAGAHLIFRLGLVRHGLGRLLFGRHLRPVAIGTRARPDLTIVYAAHSPVPACPRAPAPPPIWQHAIRPAMFRSARSVRVARSENQ